MKFDCLFLFFFFTLLNQGINAFRSKSKQFINGDRYPDDSYLIQKLDSIDLFKEMQEKELLLASKLKIENLTTYIEDNVSKFIQTKKIINNLKDTCMNIFNLNSLIANTEIQNNLNSVEFLLKKRKNFLHSDEHGNLLIFSFSDNLFDRGNFLRVVFVSKLDFSFYEFKISGDKLDNLKDYSTSFELNRLTNKKVFYLYGGIDSKGNYNNNLYGVEIDYYKTDYASVKKLDVDGQNRPYGMIDSSLSLLQYNYEHLSQYPKDKLAILVGGSNDEKVFSDIWVYKDKEFTWENLKPSNYQLNKVRKGHSSSLYYNKTEEVSQKYESISEIVNRYNLIVFGGSNGTDYFNDLLILDINHNSLENKMVYGLRTPSVVGDIPEPREGHKTLIKGDVMYLFGGCNYRNRVCYNHDIYKLRLDSYPFTWEKAKGVDEGVGMSEENNNPGVFMGYFLNFGSIVQSKIEKKGLSLIVDDAYCESLKPEEKYHLEFFTNPRTIWFFKSNKNLDNLIYSQPKKYGWSVTEKELKEKHEKERQEREEKERLKQEQEKKLTEEKELKEKEKLDKLKKEEEEKLNEQIKKEEMLKQQVFKGNKIINKLIKSGNKTSEFFNRIGIRLENEDNSKVKSKKMITRSKGNILKFDHPIKVNITKNTNLSSQDRVLIEKGKKQASDLQEIERKIVHKLLKKNLEEVLKSKVSKDREILKQTREINNKYSQLKTIHEGINSKLGEIISEQKVGKSQLEKLNKTLIEYKLRLRRKGETISNEHKEHKLITSNIRDIIGKLKDISDVKKKVNFIQFSMHELNETVTKGFSCFNGGRVVNNNQCDCPSEFTGLRCELISLCKDKNNCNGHGDCSFGKCVCEPGYTGDSCQQITSCLNNCNGNGRCSLGKCFCDIGYGGEDCNVKSGCPGDCSGRGICYREKCLCESGFKGLDCSTRDIESLACVDNCMGNGRCDLGKCICNPGFIGENCGTKEEENCPTNETGNMCSGNGICKFNICFCFPGFKGEKCDKNSQGCLYNCSGNGVCVKDSLCVCKKGFYGDGCEIANQYDQNNRKTEYENKNHTVEHKDYSSFISLEVKNTFKSESDESRKRNEQLFSQFLNKSKIFLNKRKLKVKGKSVLTIPETIVAFSNITNFSEPRLVLKDDLHDFYFGFTQDKYFKYEDKSAFNRFLVFSMSISLIVLFSATYVLVFKSQGVTTTK